jgi:hypothetical protein
MSYTPDTFARSLIGNISLKIEKVLEPSQDDLQQIANIVSQYNLDERMLSQLTQKPTEEIIRVISVMGHRTRVTDDQNGGSHHRGSQRKRKLPSRTSR